MPKYIDFTTGNPQLDEGIENYLMYGYEPGGFLQAVLTNNLFLAASRADYKNFSKLGEIARAVYHNMPADSFGTPELYRDWLKDKGGRRSAYATAKEKEFTWKSLKGQTNEKAIIDPPF